MSSQGPADLQWADLGRVQSEVADRSGGGGSRTPCSTDCLESAAVSAGSHPAGLGRSSAAGRSSLSRRERAGVRGNGAVKPLAPRSEGGLPPHPDPLPPGEGKAGGCRRWIGCPSGQFRAGEHSHGFVPPVSATSDRTHLAPGIGGPGQDCREGRILALSPRRSGWRSERRFSSGLWRARLRPAGWKPALPGQCPDAPHREGV